MNQDELEALALDLAELSPPEKKTARNPREERVIAGFEDIQRFYDEHGRAPQHGADRDIFERLYAVRLERLRALDEYRELLEPLDRQGLLANAPPVPEEIDIEDLARGLAELEAANEITELRHVRSSAERKAAEEVAERRPCADFEEFRPLLEAAAADIKSGMRQTTAITSENRSVELGDFFILDGMLLYVAEVGDPLKKTAREVDRRLRLIFDNGTESNHLLRSLQRAFYDDPAARRVEPSEEKAQLSFADAFGEDDVESGRVYVLRSLSEHPHIKQNREVIHKIGVTGGDVKKRIADAENQATYLLAKVECVAEYKLANINRNRMEKLFHKLFSSARLDITIEDRFGKPVQPKEWFLVPLHVIHEAVERIVDKTIHHYIFDPEKMELVKVR